MMRSEEKFKGAGCFFDEGAYRFGRPLNFFGLKEVRFIEPFAQAGFVRFFSSNGRTFRPSTIPTREFDGVSADVDDGAGHGLHKAIWFSRARARTAAPTMPASSPSFGCFDLDAFVRPRKRVIMGRLDDDRHHLVFERID